MNASFVSILTVRRRGILTIVGLHRYFQKGSLYKMAI